MDSQISLQEPILNGGIRSINFFNGRLLSARDLTREQSAHREADRRLGQAVGEGIAYGLDLSVSPDSTRESPVLSVEAGLAVNRVGQTLKLADRTDVALVRRALSGSSGAQIFGECVPLQTGTYIAGAGVYLLTIAPAQGVEGRAMSNGLDAVTASCNTDTLVNAVQFRLLQLDQHITAAEIQDQNRLRNLIAYKFFGVDDTDSFKANLFGPKLDQYGLLDDLRPAWLSDCDVPLGVLFWTLEDGVKFLDMWSVRRSLASRSAGGIWPLFTSGRRRSEGEAMFLQFADQADTLRRTLPSPTTVRALDHFHYLPPVGIIPLATDRFPQGFHGDLFFDEITIHPEDLHIEGARVEALVQMALRFPPVDLSVASNNRILVWVYRVRENRQRVLSDAVAGPTQPYLIFTTGHMAYLGDAHFDVNRWDFSNFA
jgi:hypothetical protein